MPSQSAMNRPAGMLRPPDMESRSPVPVMQVDTGMGIMALRSRKFLP